MTTRRYSANDIGRLMRKSKRRSGIAKKWKDWDAVEYCDNCSRNKKEVRVYPNKKIPFYLWEGKRLEVYKREYMIADLCEVCLAFLSEREMLP